ncbi:efflux RND transporter permease subunit [Pseudoalteromonas luteoviolacea]|uniref:efflux RND transporter permease subunit n=1 Tax=Pseudoalteromonas luteoviolacea TaxID=43657 RepID=UPI001EEDEE1F|nr:efflux RND transporter permease subunit [Pseudoalteromonas luteoviolacea]MCF6442166.1 efflux RND transporter permease subunit [Pseudoalteromonas luteoviolacea]
MRLVEKYGSIIIAFSFLLVLLGVFAGLKLPNALLPKIDRAQIAVVTSWPGKTAAEIEQSLISPLERQLAGLGQLKNMQTNISNGQAWTTLNFHYQADMEKVYMEVLARINQVPDWPSQVAKPRVIDFSNGAGSTLASLFLYSETEKSQEDFMHAYRAYVEPAMTDIPGITNINMDNNRLAQRVDIEFDPQKLTQFSLTIDQVTRKLQGLIDRSGDSLMLGSKEYDLHFKGQMALNELRSLPVAVTGIRVVRLGEVATVHKRFVYDWSYSSFKGNQSIYFFLQPDKDINVLETIDLIKATLAELNEGPLSSLDLKVVMSRDNSIPIKQALLLVYGNLLLGVLLACGFLYYFIRNLRVVFLIFVSIPVCLSLVLLGMQLGGRSLNLISLAGMALSVGLLLDASIIIVENIQRLRSTGLSLLQSCRQGVLQVRAALISSTLSSIVIFVPIVLMHSEVSQLFGDLAFTISSALVASILVALFLLPALSRQLLPNKQVSSGKQLSKKWTTFVTAPSRSKLQGAVWLIIAIPGALLISWWMKPELDLLPNPKENIVLVYTAFDEPLSVNAAKLQIGDVMEQRIAAQKELGNNPTFDIHGAFCRPANCLLYFYPEGDWDFPAFKKWVESEIVKDLPDARTYVYQGTLLRLALPDARTSQLDLKGLRMPELQKAGQALLNHLVETFPDARITEVIPMRDTVARIEFTPKVDTLAFMGMSQSELNQILVTLTDGAYLGQFYADSDTLPFYLKGKTPEHLEQLLQTEVMIPNHGLHPIRSLVDTQLNLAPSAIYRTDREVSMSINLVPASGQPVGPFISQVKAEVDAFLAKRQEQGLYINYRGSADQLSGFLTEFFQMFLVSLLILFLLIRVALSSWSLAIAVMLSMPLALLGGMLCLKLVDYFAPQNLDIVTMIGFIILMGLVINNAILLASQYRSAMAAGQTQQQAIIQSTGYRMRAIYMSTGTSIFGMLPLMLSPGDGSEIYRGLAAVIVGGMTFSALFSLGFMSALLSLPIFNMQPQLKDNPENEPVLES